MRVSWKWLSEWVDLSGLGSPQKLADLLTARGLEVEAVESLAHGFDRVVTAQILSRDPHPQADRLSLCRVFLGQGDPLEIVCGAQNMKAGDRVALAQIGAELPNGLKIQQSKIRGVSSFGMLCSEEELKLKEKSEGILILPAATPLGRPLAEVLGLDDTILHLKLTANRGDCFGHFGIAREVAAALGVSVKAPKTFDLEGVGKKTTRSVELNAGDEAPVFCGVEMWGVKVGPSPDWIIKRLESMGSRSINNVVDATNLVLYEMGHPVHAYDSEKIHGKKIQVRISVPGEKIPLLDGTEVEATGAELVIADGGADVGSDSGVSSQGTAIGLAGVMGGANSEVSNSTEKVFLECAVFHPTSVRRTAFRFQKRTEAAQRFEKGVDPLAPSQVMSRLVHWVRELAGGEVLGVTLVQKDVAAGAREIRCTPDWIAGFLGMQVAADRSRGILEALGCQIHESAGATSEWQVTPPSYRLDLKMREDLAEEVARSIGYDAIPETIPVMTVPPGSWRAGRDGQVDPASVEGVKDLLVRMGLCETLNFGFSSADWLKSWGVSESQSSPWIRLKNPLSEEFEVMVPSLIPGLIRNSLDHWRHHFGSDSVAIRLFEIRPCFFRDPVQGEPSTASLATGVSEKWKLALALSGPRLASALKIDTQMVDFYDLKAILQSVFDALGARGMRLVKPVEGAAQTGVVNREILLHPGKSVEILAGKQSAGFAGLIHPRLAREWKMREDLFVAEIEWGALSGMSRSPNQPAEFKAWGSFPSMERDFALLVSADVTAEKIQQVAIKVGKPLVKSARVFDVYRGSQITDGRTSIAVRLIFLDDQRSLQEAEVESSTKQIVEAWKKELGAELRG